MEVFKWLFSIEGKVVFIIGSISLHDLKNAIYGFQEALRFVNKTTNDPIYPGFQAYTEERFGVSGKTVKGWDRLITERANSEENALKMFYELLRDYCNTIIDGGN